MEQNNTPYCLISKVFKAHGINNKQYFTNVEDAYRTMYSKLLDVARKHIYNKDYGVDALQDAFLMAQSYHNKNPKMKIRSSILYVLVIRACKKYNKHSREVPFGLMNEVTED